MAIPKVCGIETEYGIMVRGADSNPVTASSLLINAYLAVNYRKVGWDFEDEHPGHDARGFAVDDLLAPDIETNLVNSVLTNGARYYVDHAHPEISTPECLTALEVVRYDRAAEEIIRESMAAAAGHLPEGAEILCHKNNSDGKGNSYGCHENYLLARAVPFGRIVSQVTPHFVTRQIVIGAGKVGCEVPGMSADDVPYQISQRADFFEEEVGLETTLKRPIVNTRDEPHCDASKYRRLHVIVGDANMSEVATYLKVGTTAIVLAMIEDDALGDDWLLANPVAAIRQVSHDPTLQRTILLRNGRRATALEVQWGMLERARKYERSHGLTAVGESVGADVLAPLGSRADRSGERHLDGGRHRRLGGQEAADRGLRRSARPEGHRRPVEGARPAVPRPAGRQVPGPPCRTADADRRRRGRERQDRAADRRHGPTSGVGAWPSGRPTSSLPTGTAWCSTSAGIRCGECR